jgi:hypothetical protein
MIIDPWSQDIRDGSKVLTVMNVRTPDTGAQWPFATSRSGLRDAWNVSSNWADFAWEHHWPFRPPIPMLIPGCPTPLDGAIATEGIVRITPVSRRLGLVGITDVTSSPRNARKVRKFD